MTASHNMTSRGSPHIGLTPLVHVVCQRPLLSRIHSTGSGLTTLLPGDALVQSAAGVPISVRVIACPSRCSTC